MESTRNYLGAVTLFSGSDPKLYDSEPTTIDIEGIKELEISKRLPEIVNFAEMCADRYPHVDYRLFNYNIKNVRLKSSLGLWLKSKLTSSEVPGVKYNPGENTLNILSKSDTYLLRLILIDMMGVNFFSVSHLNFFQQGFTYAMNLDLGDEVNVMKTSNEFLSVSDSLNRTFIEYVGNKYFDVPDVLVPNLKTIMDKINELLGDEFLIDYSKGHAFKILSDLQYSFDRASWLEFKSRLELIFNTIESKNYRNNQAMAQSIVDLNQAFEEICEILDIAIINKNNIKVRVLA